MSFPSLQKWPEGSLVIIISFQTCIQSKLLAMGNEWDYSLSLLDNLLEISVY